MVAMPRTRSRKRACSRAKARNWLRDAAAAPRPAAAIATGTNKPQRTSTRAPIGSASSAASATSNGAPIAREAAGNQREWRPSNASMRSTTIAVSSPVWCVRSRAGPACSRRDSASVRSLRRAAAPALNAARSAAIDRAARRTASAAKPAASATVSPARPARASASSIAAHNAWPTAIPVPSRPDRTTGHPARLPARRSSRSQARDAVLLCSDCIVAPISSDDTRRTGQAA